jgi:hypothetical protein
MNSGFNLSFELAEVSSPLLDSDRTVSTILLLTSCQCNFILFLLFLCGMNGISLGTSPVAKSKTSTKVPTFGKRRA